MELQQLNSNNSINSLNVDTIKHSAKAQDLNSIDSKTVASIPNGVDTQSIANKRSNIAENISSNLTTLANTGQAGATIKSQIATLDKIQENISSVKSDGTQSEAVQKDVAQSIQTFNQQAQKVNESLGKLEGFESESVSSFDAQAGQAPLNVDMLTDNISAKKAELTNSLEKVQDLQTSTIKTAQGKIQEETVKAKEQSPFKEMDFGKQSADFGDNTLSNVAGSVVSAQANTMQSVVLRLVS